MKKKNITIIIIVALMIMISGIASGKTIRKTTTRKAGRIKTVVSETVGEFSISARQGKGKTYIYWNGKKINTYKFSGKVKIIPEGKYTYSKRRSRKGKVLYIERCVGTVTTSQMDGITTNGNYISYRCLKGKAHPGDVIVTYLVYNPNTRWIDDVTDRCDAILY